MKEVINLLTKQNKTIATMESCTGGSIVNAITNIPGASNVLKYSAITYSSEYKIKMGVSKKTIDTYTVYSKEVAREMSKVIATYANASIGIGITGILEEENSQDNIVYYSIYDKDNEKYYDYVLKPHHTKRIDNKQEIETNVTNSLLTLLR